MGRPRLLDYKLVDKLAMKLGKDRDATLKQVDGYAGRKGVSSQAALVLCAEQNNIGTRTFESKLAQNVQEQILRLRQIKQTKMPVSARVVQTKRSGIKKPSAISEDFVDPNLSSHFYVTGNISSDAYPILYTLENSVRAFISRIMSTKYGDEWWEKIEVVKSTNDIFVKVVGRRNNEAENWHHGKRGVHEIYYADYDDLLRIMRVFDSDFGPYFKKVPEKNLPGRLAELVPTRNIVAHNNPITAKDFERLKVNATDWIGYMKHLHSKKSS